MYLKSLSEQKTVPARKEAEKQNIKSKDQIDMMKADEVIPIHELFIRAKLHHFSKIVLERSVPIGFWGCCVPGFVFPKVVSP